MMENSRNSRYDEIFEYVKRFLADHDGEATKTAPCPFRRRSEHIWRVFQWAQRLMEGQNFDRAIDAESVLVAALFHDIGYASLPEGSTHAEHSADIFNQYALERGFEPKQQEFITYLIKNHSKKSMINDESTPMELVILMEADCLDETGALSIVWDCMMEGAQAQQSFTHTYQHIKNYSYKAMEKNPMRTDKAKSFWQDKQQLTRVFLQQLAFDLAINEPQ